MQNQSPLKNWLNIWRNKLIKQITALNMYSVQIWQNMMTNKVKVFILRGIILKYDTQQESCWYHFVTVRIMFTWGKIDKWIYFCIQFSSFPFAQMLCEKMRVSLKKTQRKAKSFTLNHILSHMGTGWTSIYHKLIWKTTINLKRCQEEYLVIIVNFCPHNQTSQKQWKVFNGFQLSLSRINTKILH